MKTYCCKSCAKLILTSFFCFFSLKLKRRYTAVVAVRVNVCYDSHNLVVDYLYFFYCSVRRSSVRFFALFIYYYFGFFFFVLSLVFYLYLKTYTYETVSPCGCELVVTTYLTSAPSHPAKHDQCLSIV